MKAIETDASRGVPWVMAQSPVPETTEMEVAESPEKSRTEPSEKETLTVTGEDVGIAMGAWGTRGQ